ncbi:hypothetical protein ACRAWF_09145 [Streptomyces sp. L7]
MTAIGLRAGYGCSHDAAIESVADRHLPAAAPAGLPVRRRRAGRPPSGLAGRLPSASLPGAGVGAGVQHTATTWSTTRAVRAELGGERGLRGAGGDGPCARARAGRRHRAGTTCPCRSRWR